MCITFQDVRSILINLIQLGMIIDNRRKEKKCAHPIISPPNEIIQQAN